MNEENEGKRKVLPRRPQTTTKRKHGPSYLKLSDVPSFRKALRQICPKSIN